MPKTLDDLVADAKATKAKGITQYPIGLPLSTTEGASTSWYILTKAFGGDLFDKDFKPLFLTQDSAGYKAMAFIKWLTSKDFQIENYANGVLPTRTSALEDLNKAGKLNSGDALVEESKYVEPLFAQGTPTWYPQFSSAVNTAITAVAKGQVTVDQAMQNIADATTKAMTQ